MQRRKTIDGVPTREHSKDVVTPQNPLGVAGWAVPVVSNIETDEWLLAMKK